MGARKEVRREGEGRRVGKGEEEGRKEGREVGGEEGREVGGSLVPRPFTDLGIK